MKVERKQPQVTSPKEGRKVLLTEHGKFIEDLAQLPEESLTDTSEVRDVFSRYGIEILSAPGE